MNYDEKLNRWSKALMDNRCASNGHIGGYKFRIASIRFVCLLLELTLKLKQQLSILLELVVEKL